MPATSHPLLEFALNLVREAGQAVIKNERGVLSDTKEKGPLAEGDLLSHKIISEKIKQNFPGHILISEENEQSQEIGRETWVCDPICGTYNYLRGIPYFAVGLSYLKNGERELGIVYNPAREEMFFAVKGAGAYLNGERIQVGGKEKLGEAVVNFNSNFSSPEGCSKGKELFSRLCPPVVARLRLTESANLDLAYVACGRYDAYLHPLDKIWDKTAGKILVEEAGGIVLDFSQEDVYSPFGKGVIATNKKLMKPLKSVIYGS